jgi:hypothetical protein
MKKFFSNLWAKFKGLSNQTKVAIAVVCAIAIIGGGVWAGFAIANRPKYLSLPGTYAVTSLTINGQTFKSNEFFEQVNVDENGEVLYTSLIPINFEDHKAKTAAIFNSLFDADAISFYTKVSIFKIPETIADFETMQFERGLNQVVYDAIDTMINEYMKKSTMKFEKNDSGYVAKDLSVTTPNGNFDGIYKVTAKKGEYVKLTGTHEEYKEKAPGDWGYVVTGEYDYAKYAYGKDGVLKLETLIDYKFIIDLDYAYCDAHYTKNADWTYEFPNGYTDQFKFSVSHTLEKE